MNNVLTKNEEIWLEDFKTFLSNQEYDYIVSWWLALNLKVKTSVINYRLKKLVKKGFLKREELNKAYGIKYSLVLE